MNKHYVVIDEYGDKLQFDSAPWGDGDCLVHTTSMFTIFESRKDANYALRVSIKYAKKNKLCEVWNIEKWKVIEFNG